jgi:hypothetical protein
MRGTRLDAAYRFAMFQTGLPLLKISMLLEICGRKFHHRVKGIFSYSDPPRAGMPIGVWDRRQGEQGVRGVLYAPQLSAGRPGCGIKTSAIDNWSSTFWRARI